MIDFSHLCADIKRRAISWLLACCLIWSSSLAPASAVTTAPTLAKELINLPQIPFFQFPPATCTQQLQIQFNQQAKIPLNCNIGDLIPAEKILTVGNFASMGLTQSSLWQIANANQIDLHNITADQLQDFYSLITPNKLLSFRFGNFYHRQTLGDLPLIQAALLQEVASKIQMGDLGQLRSINALLQTSGFRGFTDFFTPDALNNGVLRQQLSQLELGKLVAVLPEFGDFSLAKLPTSTLRSFSVAEAIPALGNQSIGNIAGVESLKIGDFGAVGMPNLSLAQMPNPITLATGVNFGRFDLPLNNDEKDTGRQLSGGIPNGDYQLRQQPCADKCKFAEIAVPNTSYHGSTWVDGNEHWVPDGFGIVCWAWPGGCKGPAGNHPFGRNLRLLLTNIDAAAGTAQVSITFPMCWDVLFVGTTCTPAIFPIASGIPLYTIREGDWLPFIVPANYGDKTANSSPPSSPDRPISKPISKPISRPRAV